jgi:hypothetical protein
MWQENSALLVAAIYLANLFIFDLGKGRIHHQDEADRNGDVRGPGLKAVYKLSVPGIK